MIAFVFAIAMVANSAFSQTATAASERLPSLLSVLQSAPACVISCLNGGDKPSSIASNSTVDAFCGVQALTSAMQNQTSSAPQTAVASDAPLNLCIKSKCSSSDLQTWVSLQQTYAMTIMSECLGSLLGELLGGMLSGPAAVLQTLTTLNGAPKCFVGCLFGDIPSVITEANLAKFCTPLIASMSATAKPTATAQVDPTSACIMSKCGTSDQLSLQSLMTGNFSMNLISACMYETTLVGKGPVSVAASSTTTTATTTASKTSGGFDLIPKLSFLPMRLLFLFLFLWV